MYDYSSDSNPPASSTPFAPEVIYFNGKFYLIASPSGNGHYVLESDSPEGPFVNVSGNIGLSIDGHHFIDGKDERIYLFTAGSSGLRGYEVEDDMYTIKQDDNGNDIQTTYLNCVLGGWNEGPYMLQKNGNYYLTYTGTHYLSASYRVNYAYASKESEVIKQSSFVEQDTILLSTTDTFRGLGHSSTVLGPDLDSYYIIYHNLEKSSRRNLNYSRLSFNGARMVADSVKEYNNPGFNLPEFSTYDSTGFNLVGDKLLSSKSSDDCFTVEFNTVGEGKMIFSYKDDDNYSYIEFVNNTINVYKITNGKTQLVHSVDLIRDYSTDVNHTFRLQYRDGKMSLYFDTMEKAYDINCKFEGGKIGYFNDEFTEIGYTAYSNVALGSSDSKSYNTQVSLANAYDERLSYLTSGSGLVTTGTKETYYIQANSYNLVLANEGNRATYRTYLENEYYSFDLRVPAKYAGKKIGVRIDAGEVVEVTIPDASKKYKNGDIVVSLGVYDISEGQHHISLYNVGDEVGFSEIMYNPVYENEVDITFNTSFDKSEYFTKNSINLSDKGFSTDSQPVCGLITKTDFFNATIEASLVLNELHTAGYAGIVFNSTAYSVYPAADGDGVDYAYPYCGFLLAFTSDEIILKYVEFKNQTTLSSKTYRYEPGVEVNVKIVQNNNNYKVYLNDELLFDVNANVCSLSGGVGVFAALSDVEFKYLKATS